MAKKKKPIIVNFQYNCIHGQHKATLVDVKNGTKESIHSDLAKFARTYGHCVTELETGFLAVLQFIGNKNIPFTIIQKCRSDSFNKFRAVIGEEFDVLQLPAVVK